MLLTLSRAAAVDFVGLIYLMILAVGVLYHIIKFADWLLCSSY